MAHNYNKIILNLMIKNESKIIERCITRVKDHVDAISILDTGSTDNTLEICKTVLEKINKPYILFVEPFKNFGYNRTYSFKQTQKLCKDLNWNSEETYALTIDADMIFMPSPDFKNTRLTATGYSVIQQNPQLRYYNSRLMKCAYDWKCIGSTHEYWSGEPTKIIPYEVCYIDDVNDGGCKSDKFERDIRLLTEDIKENPNNDRSYFYLAQSYKDIGNFETAIQLYKKRIEIGGWIEEVWYSYYQIAKCLENLKQYEDMEAWALKAFNYHPKRAEPLYYLTNYFKNKYEHFKAYQYYLKGKDIPFPKDDVLFIEYQIYNGLFEYEYTILSYYIFNKTKQNVLNDIVNYINNRSINLHSVWHNMEHYTEPLVNSTYKAKYNKLFFPNLGEYQASSCSFIAYNNEFILNVRYVNYSIDNTGKYIVRTPDGHVKTKNGFTILNSSYYPLTNITQMKEELFETFPSNIEGLEDIRLFIFNNKLKFSCSSKNLRNDGKIYIAMGDYDIENKLINNVTVIDPPQNSDCEKNWIYIPTYTDRINFIYGWHPLKIGAVNNNNKLEIHTIYNTPRFFENLRGSSNICEYDGRLWCVTHFVKYSTPRIYMHCIICFDRNNMKPIMYSLPFVFVKHAIEYCLGLHICDGIIYMVFSQNDNDPAFITVPITNLLFL